MARTIDPYDDEYEEGYGGGTYSPSLIRRERERQGLISPTPTAIPTTQPTLPPMTAPAMTPATTPVFPTATTPTAATTVPTTPTTTPATPTAAATYPAFNLGEFGGEYAQFDPVVSSFINQFAAPLQRGAFMDPAPDVTQRLQNILTTGGFIPESMETYGAGLAGLPTGGLAPTQDIVSQFAAGGQDIPVQTTANQQLQNLMQGAGISSDFERAARETIFDPSMEAFRGQINKRGGGVVDPNSGLALELERRAERDFQNQMLMTGQGNLANFLQLGLAGGQQQYGQDFDRARVAASREGMLGGLGTGGVTQGMNFLSQISQQRAQQEEQLGAFVRAILSGVVQPTPGILGALISSGLGGAGDIIGAIGNIVKPPPAKGTPGKTPFA